MALQEREPLTMSTGSSRYGAATPDAPLAGGTDAIDLKLWTGTFNLHLLYCFNQIREWLVFSTWRGTRNKYSASTDVCT